MAVIRDQLTDFYFAYNFPPERLDEAIHHGLAESATVDQHPGLIDFNPELAPMDLLFAQGKAYAALPPAELAPLQHHLREIVVVLIKSMLSDQLEFVGIAKEILTIDDLVEVRRHLIGHGKIGGKAAGLLLAQKMLASAQDEEGRPWPCDARRTVRLLPRRNPRLLLHRRRCLLRLSADQRLLTLYGSEIPPQRRDRRRLPRNRESTARDASRARSSTASGRARRSRRPPPDRALLKPAGSPLRRGARRQIRKRLLPEPGHAR